MQSLDNHPERRASKPAFVSVQAGQRVGLAADSAPAALRSVSRETLRRGAVGVLVWDVAFVMLCERLSNYGSVITFVLKIELFVPRILSMKYRSK